MLALLAFAGVKGFPLYENIEDLVEKMGGVNIRSEITKRLEGWKGDLAKYGLPGLVGIDLTGSISMEVPRELSEVPGIVTDILIDMPTKVKEDIQRHDYKRALEDVSPAVARNALKGYREATEGITTRGGVPVKKEGVPQRLTPTEAILKALGFQSTKASELYRQQSAIKDVQAGWEERKDALLDEYHRMRTRYGRWSPEVQDVRDRMRKFNSERPRHIAPISQDTLKTRLRKTKRERAAEKEIK